jgi:hypothetical protein
MLVKLAMTKIKQNTDFILQYRLKLYCKKYYSTISLNPDIILFPLYITWSANMLHIFSATYGRKVIKKIFPSKSQKKC